MCVLPCQAGVPGRVVGHGSFVKWTPVPRTKLLVPIPVPPETYMRGSATCEPWVRLNSHMRAVSGPSVSKGMSNAELQEMLLNPRGHVSPVVSANVVIYGCVLFGRIEICQKIWFALRLTMLF